ncbi:mechanosensitive ion channel family protein [Pantoea sp. S18]|uniref:mechanosensitive ion channel family protein n=1 Tax=Pantoea sp. S18 TaxID=3019892 RepID=UPI0012AD3022|nr:mechanosensitive ion channel family protein [Pantoea sp. S18]MEA5102582.1 mechanosensitive ion channel family protein [Pantoea sp. S18]MRT26023.1 mechanosensitive ion channel [Enterobacteriaceae bacterium RIT697]MRT40629.1 mechanosensitive ion channel [Enterobacteriaceae bacterium RIT702]
MQHLIANRLAEAGLSYTHIMALGIVIAIIFAISLITHAILHRAILPLLRRSTEKSSRQWPKALINSRLFSRSVWLMQGVLFKLQTELFLHDSSQIYPALLIFAQLWMMIFALLMLFSLLDLLQQLSANSMLAQQLPLRGIIQSVKLIAAILMVIMIISLLLGKSPGVLITGLGAMTAVLMLVFKDPILGLVAGIQLAANNMLKMNDWLEMPKYGADGAVIDISLTTVKVRNWDNTIVTIPAYALISDSFKNWRGMSESGGRRIKRSINIDTTSITFLDDTMMQQLKSAHLLTPYLNSKSEEVAAWNAQLGCDLDSPLNGRRLTNVGTFRVWLQSWLEQHPRIHKEMTLMVRQLAPGENGLPVEVYVFTNTTVWAEYENIQADIFDHIYAVLPTFGLRVHQSPTGNDMRQIGVRTRH